MKIYRSLAELPNIKNAIVTQGTFDGVHAAHQVILDRLKQIAKQVNGETVVMTFNPHPRMILFPENHGLKLLQTLDEKTEALKHSGIDHLVIIPFTHEFSLTDSMHFIRDTLVGKLHTHTLVIGYNHRFGKNREGTFEHLKEFAPLYGFQIEEIPEQDVENESVSSTRIRKALESGNIVLANKYLGYEYFITGEVVKGKQLGRTIGFPTANIVVNDSNKLLPADGVYAVRVFINNNLYDAMLNSGYRPTVDGSAHATEVHIFGFDADVYGKIMTIQYVDKLRDEMKFASLEELKSQLEKDKLHALKILQAP